MESKISFDQNNIDEFYEERMPVIRKYYVEHNTIMNDMANAFETAYKYWKEERERCINLIENHNKDQKNEKKSTI
jgi:hypothetical protein